MAESGLNTVSESTKEFLETNEYAQKAQEIGNQAIEIRQMSDLQR